jgi:hypothetical protein
MPQEAKGREKAETSLLLGWGKSYAFSVSGRKKQENYHQRSDGGISGGSYDWFRSKKKDKARRRRTKSLFLTLLVLSRNITLFSFSETNELPCPVHYC